MSGLGGFAHRSSLAGDTFFLLAGFVLFSDCSLQRKGRVNAPHARAPSSAPRPRSHRSSRER